MPKKNYFLLFFINSMKNYRNKREKNLIFFRKFYKKLMIKISSFKNKTFILLD